MAVQFDRGFRDMEARARGDMPEPRFHVSVADFRHRAAMIADGESGQLVMVRLVAGDEGIERFNAVGQPVPHQPFERAIDRRRRVDAFAAQLA